MVAPTSVTRPSSTAGSSASCWALLKRWISSRKKIVAPAARGARARARSPRAPPRGPPGPPRAPRRRRRRARRPCARASSCPCRAGRRAPSSADGRTRSRCAARSPRPSRCSWPTKSSSVRGRMRAASGPSPAAAAGRASSARAPARRGCSMVRYGRVWRRRAPVRVAAADRGARVGAHRADRLRRPAGARRAAARARRRAPRLDRRSGVRGRQRRLRAPARAGLDAARDLLRAAGRRAAGRAGRRARVHPPRAADHPRDRRGRARRRPAGWILGVGAGAGAAVVAVVVHAGIALGRSRSRGRRDRRGAAYLARRAVATVPRRARASCSCCSAAGWSSWRGAGARGAAVHAWPLALAGAAALPALAWTALKVGALSYGGGFVIIPLMQADAVDAHGWMTRPSSSTRSPSGSSPRARSCRPSALVGYAAAGLGGALLAAAVAFAPSFLVVAAGRRALRAAARERRGARVPGRRRAGRGGRDRRRRGAARGRARGAWQLAVLAAAGVAARARPARRCSRSPRAARRRAAGRAGGRRRCREATTSR